MFASRFHSFLLAIGLGGALAAMLLFNSVANYISITERISQDKSPRRTEAGERMRTRLQRNLAINCSAGVALLVALAVIGRRFRSYVDARRIESELEMARQVQKTLLPGTRQRLADSLMSAECTPATEVGGDFYDAFVTPDGGVACVIGDVCGKGLPAALLMGVMHGAVRSSDWYSSRRSHEDATLRLNSLLCDRLSANRFASLFWGYRAAGSNSFRYVNAGHCVPLLVRRGSTGTMVISLDGGGPVLGLLRSAHFQQCSVALAPGDILVMYSDGLVEAANHAGEEWGEHHLRAVLESSDAATPEALRIEIAAAMKRWTGPGACDDDCTLMVVDFQPEASRTGSLLELAAVS